ncbi:unnamed protein product [Penicillium bialowiezense]
MSTHAFLARLSLVETDGHPSSWPTVQSESSQRRDLRTSLMPQTLSAFAMPETVATFAPAEFESLSTGAPKMAAGWWTCCNCKQMVNPNLAPESRENVQ